MIQKQQTLLVWIIRTMTEEEINANLAKYENLINKMCNYEKLNDKECLEIILSYTIKSPEQIKAVATNLLHKYWTLPNIIVTPSSQLIEDDGLSSDTVTMLKMVKSCALKIMWENLE